MEPRDELDDRGAEEHEPSGGRQVSDRTKMVFDVHRSWDGVYELRAVKVEKETKNTVRVERRDLAFGSKLVLTPAECVFTAHDALQRQYSKLVAACHRAQRELELFHKSFPNFVPEETE